MENADAAGYGVTYYAYLCPKSKTRAQFDELFRTAFPKPNAQLALGLPPDEDDEEPT
jgi:hypothetical protein